tara:strand:- start:2252 stop:2563 length:312 start_codon:yes stop_codon:yes gene_type:complete
MENNMASRKRIYTSKTLKVIDVASTNVDKCLGIISLVKNQIKMDFEGTEKEEDYENTLWAVQTLLFEIKKAGIELDKEELIYADTLDEYLADVKVEVEQQLNS